MKRDTVEMYVDKEGKWRWSYLASNGKIMADSGQGYARKQTVFKAIEQILGYDEWDLTRAVPFDGFASQPEKKMFTKVQYGSMHRTADSRSIDLVVFG